MYDPTNRKLAEEVSKLMRNPNVVQIQVGPLDTLAMSQLLSACLGRPIKQVLRFFCSVLNSWLTSRISVTRSITNCI